MTRKTGFTAKSSRSLTLITGAALGMAVSLAGCGADSSDDASDAAAPQGAAASASADIKPDTEDAEHADVLAAVLSAGSDGQWSLEVTLSSEYDSPERYADGWRVLDQNGNVLGEHTLTHDHASEQPATRTQSDLDIPAGVDVVTIEGKDTENGYGGARLEVEVPR